MNFVVQEDERESCLSRRFKDCDAEEQALVMAANFNAMAIKRSYEDDERLKDQKYKLDKVKLPDTALLY
jgi:hypothetical protein